nr:hypothetical protein [Tanacetum cinerariifolium]
MTCYYFVTKKMDVNLYMFGVLMLYWVYRHVYSTDIIIVDQGRCKKWGMKLTKEVANPRCLSYSICNPAVKVRYCSDPTRPRYKVGSLIGDPSGCCEVGGGGGGGVVGSISVVCGDVVDRGVGGVDCGVVCGFVCGVVCGGGC